jgi:hypothetical protein
MELLHTKTNLEEELISILIETFENHGWTIEQLPDIYDSDEQKVKVHLNQKDYWDYDNFLGVYRQLKNSWCNQGEVVLFTENIQKVAQAFYEKDNAPMRNSKTGKLISRENGELTRKSDLIHYLVEGQNPDYGITLNDNINYLTAIVLIHELTHSLIHWGKDFNQESLRCDLQYKDGDLKDFHEGLAQYFTENVLIVYGNSKIYDIFNFLKDRQSKPYKVFEELKKDLNKNYIDISSVFTALAICWFDRFCQSFIKLKSYNNSIHEVFDNEYFEHFLIAIKGSKKPQKQEELSYLFKVLDRHSFFEKYFTEEFLAKNKIKIISKKFGL